MKAQHWPVVRQKKGFSRYLVNSSSTFAFTWICLCVCCVSVPFGHYHSRVVNFLNCNDFLERVLGPEMTTNGIVLAILDATALRTQTHQTLSPVIHIHSFRCNSVHSVRFAFH